MRLFTLIFLVIPLLCTAIALNAQEKEPAPSHLMIGPGLFDVDRTHPRPLVQLEYRWEVNCHHIRPLVSFFIAADGNFFVCGGLGYDIFLGKRVVITPSFAPGIYYHGHGKKLGFPINFRSAIEMSYIFKTQGRIGAQFNHISNAHMLMKNPGANSLILFYAIPFPIKKKGHYDANP